MLILNSTLLKFHIYPIFISTLKFVLLALVSVRQHKIYAISSHLCAFVHGPVHDLLLWHLPKWWLGRGRNQIYKTLTVLEHDTQSTLERYAVDQDANSPFQCGPVLFGWVRLDLARSSFRSPAEPAPVGFGRVWVRVVLEIPRVTRDGLI